MFVMNAALKKHLRRTQKGKGIAFSLKRSSSSTKTKKKIRKGNHYSRLDAQVIVRLLREPYRPSEATLEIGRICSSIPRIEV